MLARAQPETASLQRVAGLFKVLGNGTKVVWGGVITDYFRIDFHLIMGLLRQC